MYVSTMKSNPGQDLVSDAVTHALASVNRVMVIYIQGRDPVERFHSDPR